MRKASVRACLKDPRGKALQARCQIIENLQVVFATFPLFPSLKRSLVASALAIRFDIRTFDSGRAVFRGHLHKEGSWDTRGRGKGTASHPSFQNPTACRCGSAASSCDRPGHPRQESVRRSRRVKHLSLLIAVVFRVARCEAIYYSVSSRGI